MSSRRLVRMGEEIKKLVSNLILNEIKDPRVSPMTSVIQVEVTKDLSFAKIYVSVMGSEKEKQETLAGLNSSKGFIRREIGRNIQMRVTPEPVFELDSSIDHGIRISEMLRDINKK